MSDIVERLRAAHPISVQYSRGSMILAEAADEIESLRQRVAELEVVIKDFAQIERGMEEELAALKAGQGEPVCYLREEWLSYEQSAEGQPGAFPVYSAPTMLTEQAPCDIPEGWQLVPVEPTTEMIRKGVHAWYDCTRESDNSVWIDCYKAMLTAAPKPEE